MCHWSFYQRIVRLFKHGEDQIFTRALHLPVKPFDEKFFVCEACHKHLNKNEIPWQAVQSNMALDLIPGELKNFNKIEKVLIYIRYIYFLNHFVHRLYTKRLLIWNHPTKPIKIFLLQRVSQVMICSGLILKEKTEWWNRIFFSWRLIKHAQNFIKRDNF